MVKRNQTLKECRAFLKCIVTSILRGLARKLKQEMIFIPKIVIT